MSNFLMGVGALTVLALSAAVFFAAYGYYLDRVAYRREQADWKASELAVRKMGIRMLQGHYWFSENHDAQAAIRATGESLRDHAQWEPDKVRAAWRDITIKKDPK